MGLRTGALPDFPWDTLVTFAEKARAHPGGIVDLSVGTPGDPTPAVVRDALTAAAEPAPSLTTEPPVMDTTTPTSSPGGY